LDSPLGFAAQVELRLTGRDFDMLAVTLPFGKDGSSFLFDAYPRLQAEFGPNSAFSSPAIYAQAFERMYAVVPNLQFYMGGTGSMPSTFSALYPLVIASVQPFMSWAAKYSRALPTLYVDGSGDEPFTSQFFLVNRILRELGFTSVGVEGPPTARTANIFMPAASTPSWITGAALAEGEAHVYDWATDPQPLFSGISRTPGSGYFIPWAEGMPIRVLEAGYATLAEWRARRADGYVVAPNSLDVYNNNWTKADFIV
jgi:hypothetical protein